MLAVLALAWLVSLPVACGSGEEEVASSASGFPDADVQGVVRLRQGGRGMELLDRALSGAEAPIPGLASYRGLPAVLDAVRRSSRGEVLTVFLLDPDVHGGNWAVRWKGDRNAFESTLRESDAVLEDEHGWVVDLEEEQSFLGNFVPGRKEEPARTLAERAASLPEVLRRARSERRELCELDDGELLLLPRREGLRNLERSERALGEGGVTDTVLEVALARSIRRVRGDWEDALLPLLLAAGVAQERLEHRLRALLSIAFDLAESFDRLVLTVDGERIELRLRALPGSFAEDLCASLRTEESRTLLASLPPGMVAFAVSLDPDAWSRTVRRWVDPHYRWPSPDRSGEGRSARRAFAVASVGTQSFVEIGFEDDAETARGLDEWRDTLQRWQRSDRLGLFTLLSKAEDRERRGRGALEFTEADDRLFAPLGSVGRDPVLRAFAGADASRLLLVAAEDAKDRTERELVRLHLAPRRSSWSLAPGLPETAAMLVRCALPFLEGSLHGTVEGRELVIDVELRGL